MIDILWDQVDRTAIGQRALGQQDDDADFWLHRPVCERVAGIEHLRRLTHGDTTIDARVQRVLETAKLGER